jgi:hypothetical protein
MEVVEAREIPPKRSINKEMTNSRAHENESRECASYSDEEVCQCLLV